MNYLFELKTFFREALVPNEPFDFVNSCVSDIHIKFSVAVNDSFDFLKPGVSGVCKGHGFWVQKVESGSMSSDTFLI